MVELRSTATVFPIILGMVGGRYDHPLDQLRAAASEQV